MIEKENTYNDSDNYEKGVSYTQGDDIITTRLNTMVKIFSKSPDLEGIVNRWLEVNDPQELSIIPTFDGGIILSYRKFRQDKIKIVRRYKQPQEESLLDRNI
jgi:hypothetical protein